MNTLFLGNGLSLLEGGLKWSDLLTRISGIVIKENRNAPVPYTLQYEEILSKGANVCKDPLNEEKKIDIKAIEKEAQKTVAKAKELVSANTNEMYKQMISLPFSQIITTNYDAAVTDTLKEMGYSLNSKSFQERLYSIRRYVSYKKGEEIKAVHYAHGDIQHPYSIMLGLNHYCGSIGKINEYIKGKYTIQDNVITEMYSRLRAGISEIKSWIDLFFCSDVYIVGYGLDYSDIDLWWILNIRNRYLQHGCSEIIKNKIVFLGEIEKSKKELLESFSVTVNDYDPKNNYKKMYETIYDAIKNQIT